MLSPSSGAAQTTSEAKSPLTAATTAETDQDGTTGTHSEKTGPDSVASSVPPKRVSIEAEDIAEMEAEGLREKWKEQEKYLDHLETKVREIEAKAQRKEHLLVMRLSTKEQEIQELTNQVKARTFIFV